MLSQHTIKLESMDLLKNTSSLEAIENVPTFLSKTYEILQNPDYNDIISWTRNGEGFIVKKVKEFSEKILPLHFRHSNYSSFVRQLNMYDFHKMRQDNQENAFKNTLFKKSQKHLLKEIQRKDYKKNKDLRLQVNFKHDDVHRKKRIQGQQNLLSKELEIELQAGRLFEGSYVVTNKSLSELINTQNNLLVELQKELETEGELKVDEMIDVVMKLKTLNHKYDLNSKHSSERLSNFLFAKYLKWSSLISDEKSKSKGKATEFPSWANIISSSTFCGSSKLVVDF